MLTARSGLRLGGHDLAATRRGRPAGSVDAAELLADDFVEPLLVQQQRDLVDVVGVHRGDHRALLDVGEQRDLAALLGRQRVLAAAEQHVGLDADRAQLLHRVLRRLGLDLARGRDVRDQRQVHVEHVVAPEFDAELADRLEERQRLDVAHRAADLDHADVGVAGAHADAVLDLVGDVRDDLHRRAEVVAAALLGDDALVDAPGGEVAVAAGGRAHEALVVAEVEVGLGAVVGDEDLAVLERAHRARVHVDVRVELDHRDLEAAGLEDRAERGGSNALAQRGNDTAGHEDEFGHWRPRRREARRESSLADRRAVLRPPRDDSTSASVNGAAALFQAMRHDGSSASRLRKFAPQRPDPPRRSAGCRRTAAAGSRGARAARRAPAATCATGGDVQLPAGTERLAACPACARRSAPAGARD